jgi:hypothetical protein
VALINDDKANTNYIENETVPLHDRSQPYTLEELRKESDFIIIETLAEIDQIDDGMWLFSLLMPYWLVYVSHVENGFFNNFLL